MRSVLLHFQIPGCSGTFSSGIVSDMAERTFVRGPPCGAEEREFLAREGSAHNQGGTASCSQASQAHGRALSARLSLCRMALILMVFVNYGGGKYWYFKHSSWNGEPLPGGRLADSGPFSLPQRPQRCVPMDGTLDHCLSLQFPSPFCVPWLCNASLSSQRSAEVGAKMWALQRVLERGCEALLLF